MDEIRNRQWQRRWQQPVQTGRLQKANSDRERKGRGLNTDFCIWSYIQHIEKQRHYFANKGPSSQSCDFSSSHVWVWELDHKEGWALKNWCFWTAVLEKTLESPLDCKEIQPAHPKGDQPWIFIGRTDAEAEALILWPPVKSWLIRKDPDAGKDWGQEEKGKTEDMVGWRHWLSGHESEYTLGVGDGQGGLACCSPRGCNELYTTEWLSNILYFTSISFSLICLRTSLR